MDINEKTVKIAEVLRALCDELNVNICGADDGSIMVQKTGQWPEEHEVNWPTTYEAITINGRGWIGFERKPNG